LRPKQYRLLRRTEQLIEPERGIAWLSSSFFAMRLKAARPRRVNSGVRFLLNGKDQSFKSAILNFNEAEDCLSVVGT